MYRHGTLRQTGPPATYLHHAERHIILCDGHFTTGRASRRTLAFLLSADADFIPIFLGFATRATLHAHDTLVEK